MKIKNYIYLVPSYSLCEEFVFAGRSTVLKQALQFAACFNT